MSSKKGETGRGLSKNFQITLQFLPMRWTAVSCRISLIPSRLTGLFWTRRELTDQKVSDSNPTPASQVILSRFGQLGSVSALVLPSGGMTAKHQKVVTDERLSLLLHSRRCTEIKAVSTILRVMMSFCLDSAHVSFGMCSSWTLTLSD
ncbi:hypothetical protein CSKR_105376 [Clonorchis sinensis]|uniref:Uncharacterized protein n=1 Tax=Clonorchis sinensis TaxID=79923 RepID=A0A419Q7X3_CLOSI|nr:hypothetical protein CSKR_105376 [Clonorchis sinensis]